MLIAFSTKAQVNFQWAKGMGGTFPEEGRSVIVDGSGNVYTTGHFEGTVDFDPNGGVFNLTSTGYRDIFISKLDASGNFIWAKNIGATNLNYGFSILTDVGGNVYTTGFFDGTADFDPGIGVFNLISTGGLDSFISKLDANGNFIWAKSWGADVSFSIAFDAIGNIYTTGYFQGTADFDPGAGVFNLTAIGIYDVSISKLDAIGNFIWAKSMGGPSSANAGNSITIDASGNVYTTGSFENTVDFNPGAGVFNLTAVGSYDIFIHKMSQSPLEIKGLAFDSTLMEVFPNPNNGMFKLILKDKIENVEIVLINSLGQEVHRQPIIQGANEVITTGLAKGLYNYITLQDKQKIKCDKLIIE